MRPGKIIDYYHTIRNLTLRQILFQVLYRLGLPKIPKEVHGPAETESLKLLQGIPKPVTYIHQKFTFLNQSKMFEKTEWNYMDHGMLWNYNLNYMDFLLQPGMDHQTGLQFIREFIAGINHNPHGLEPYPISLRGMNWIRFLSRSNISDAEINLSLFKQYKILNSRFEYHIAANHLLENAFSLLFAAFYFKSDRWYEKASKVLSKELNEQILADGGHIERSPMYHQIMLDRVLDCVNLLQNNPLNAKQENLLDLLKAKASVMLTWLNRITFPNGEPPMLKDAAPGIAPGTDQLNQYAAQLGLTGSYPEHGYFVLTQSGYRVFHCPVYSCIADVGNITPRYQPGHAHADSLNFVVHCKGKPFVVDTGVSTYEKNERRIVEKGTSSHNTVLLKDINSSEVWDGFRVGRRAEIISVEDKEAWVNASHNGYKTYGVVHNRTFIFSEDRLEIADRNALTTGVQLQALIHLHPGVNCRCENDTVYCDEAVFSFSGHTSLKTSEYLYAHGFNDLCPAKVIELTFTDHLKTVLLFKVP